MPDGRLVYGNRPIFRQPPGKCFGFYDSDGVTVHGFWITVGWSSDNISMDSQICVHGGYVQLMFAQARQYLGRIVNSRA